MSSEPPRIHFSFARLWTIACNTMTEVIRQKFFYVLVLFAVVFLTGSVFLAQFSTIDPIKFIKDYGLGVIMFFGAVIAIVGTAELLPLELENRTIYPILAKPVHRSEFLLGKLTGMLLLLLLTIIAMSVIFGVLLLYAEQGVLANSQAGGAGMPMPEVNPSEVAQMVHRQTWDPNLLWAISLIYFKLVIVCSIGLLIGTFATSVIFNVICNAVIYICGHLIGTARQEWINTATLSFSLKKLVLGILVFVVPDMDFFNVADAVVTGQYLSMELVFQAIGYGLFYSLVILLVANFIFDSKEI